MFQEHGTLKFPVVVFRISVKGFLDVYIHTYIHMYV